jgi:ketosteroid isomerase-like protein
LTAAASASSWTELRDVHTPREVSESYWAAECRRDIDGVMAHYHTDATHEGPNGLRRGHAEIRKAYEDSARDYPGLEVRIVQEFGGGAEDCSALEFDAVLIDLEGRRFRVRGVNVVVVRDGKFVSARSYEDPPMPEQVPGPSTGSGHARALSVIEVWSTLGDGAASRSRSCTDLSNPGPAAATACIQVDSRGHRWPSALP